MSVRQGETNNFLTRHTRKYNGRAISVNKQEWRIFSVITGFHLAFAMLLSRYCPLCVIDVEI